MSGGGSQTTTTKTELDPTTQRFRNDLLNNAQGLYNQGPGAFQTAMAPQTQQGLKMLETQAGAGAPNLGLANMAGAKALSGWNPAQPFAINAAAGGLDQSNPYTGALAAVGMQAGAAQTPLTGGPSVSTSGVTSAGGQTTTAGIPTLQRAADGQMVNPWAGQAITSQGDTTLGLFSSGALNGNNPYAQAYGDRIAGEAARSASSLFSGAGRYGSGAHQESISRGVGDALAGFYAPLYENDMNRMYGASQDVASLARGDRDREVGIAEAGFGRQTDAANAMAGYQANDLQRSTQAQVAALEAKTAEANRKAAAEQASRQLQMQGMGLNLQALQTAGSLFGQQSAQNTGNRLAGIEMAGGFTGQANEDAARAAALLPSLYQYGSAPGQQLVNIGGVYEGQNQQNQLAPWEALNAYANVMSGLPTSTTTTQRGPGGNSALTGVGGAMAGAQLGSMLFPGIGTAVGAGLGGLAGLFG